jgi:hypothetical protein
VVVVVVALDTAEDTEETAELIDATVAATTTTFTTTTVKVALVGTRDIVVVVMVSKEDMKAIMAVGITRSNNKVIAPATMVHHVRYETNLVTLPTSVSKYSIGPLSHPIRKPMQQRQVPME